MTLVKTPCAEELCRDHIEFESLLKGYKPNRKQGTFFKDGFQEFASLLARLLS